MQKKIYGIDSLRTLLMLLVVLGHCLLPYMIPGTTGWPLPDPYEKSIYLTVLAGFINTFVMPAFMMISGYFSAMLYCNKGARKLFTNRFKKIFIPFLLALIFILPLQKYLMFLAMEKIYPEDFIIKDHSVIEKVFNPKVVDHLWFLNYLFIYTIIAICIAIVIQKINLKLGVNKSISWLIDFSKTRLVLLFLLSSLLLYFTGNKEAHADIYLVPNLCTLGYYLLFFFQGWMLYINNASLYYKRNKILTSLFFAIILNIIYMYLRFNYTDDFNVIIILCFTCSAWLYCYGLIGLFMQTFNKEYSFTKFLSKASYWIYLVHVIFVIIFSALLANFKLPPLLKSLLLFSSVISITLFSYYYIVRNSFLGKFLNGKSNSRK